MRSDNLWIVLSIAILLTLVMPSLVSWWHFHTFLAPLILGLYRLSSIQVLWLAASCGLFIDFLTAPLPFGAHALAYAGAISLLCRTKNILFTDGTSTLPLLALLGSCCCSLLLITIFALSGHIPTPSWHMICIDTPLLALSDALLTVSFCSLSPCKGIFTKIFKNSL